MLLATFSQIPYITENDLIGTTIYQLREVHHNVQKTMRNGECFQLYSVLRVAYRELATVHRGFARRLVGFPGVLSRVLLQSRTASHGTRICEFAIVEQRRARSTKAHLKAINNVFPEFQ